jgi:hypothetical protein
MMAADAFHSTRTRSASHRAVIMLSSDASPQIVT